MNTRTALTAGKSNLSYADRLGEKLRREEAAEEAAAEGREFNGGGGGGEGGEGDGGTSGGVGGGAGTGIHRGADGKLTAKMSSQQQQPRKHTPFVHSIVNDHESHKNLRRNLVRSHKNQHQKDMTRTWHGVMALLAGGLVYFTHRRLTPALTRLFLICVIVHHQ